MRRPEFIARQAACPSGLLGRLIGHVMARETAAANGIAVELLELEPSDRVLEVGFGHGATIARVATAVNSGFVAGIDPSAEMGRMAARRNRREVASGRVELRQASAEAIPYLDQSFDKVLTVHTVYFWTDLERPLREIARVMKPRGRFLLAHRTDAAIVREFPDSVYRFPSIEQVDAALARAGLAVRPVAQRMIGPATVAFHVALR